MLPAVLLVRGFDNRLEFLRGLDFMHRVRFRESTGCQAARHAPTRPLESASCRPFIQSGVFGKGVFQLPNPTAQDGGAAGVRRRYVIQNAEADT